MTGVNLSQEYKFDLKSENQLIQFTILVEDINRMPF